MNRISEQIKPFSSSLTPHWTLDLVSGCEHFSVTCWVSFSMGQWFLTATLHIMSAFFPRTWLKRRKICLNSMQSDKLSSEARLSSYASEAVQLRGTWTCRNMITINMHGFGAKQTSVERMLWTHAVASISSKQLWSLRSWQLSVRTEKRCLTRLLVALCCPWGPAKILEPVSRAHNDPLFTCCKKRKHHCSLIASSTAHTLLS